MATLFCAEALRPVACLVVDSLTARGWDVRLISGSDARGALRRSTRGPSFGLRVVCVPHPLHADVLVQMRRVLDPYGRGDLLVSPLETPKDVIEQVVGFYRSESGMPRRRQTTTRAYLSHPTLLEETATQTRRWASYGLAGAAATAATLGALYLGSNPGALQLAERGAPPVDPVQVAAPRESSPLVDHTVYSAAARAPMLDDLFDDAELEIPEPRPLDAAPPVRPRRPRAQRRYVEEVIIIEDDEDELMADRLSMAQASEEVISIEPELGDDALLELDEMAQVVVDAQTLTEITSASVEDEPARRGRSVTFDPFASGNEATPNFH